MRRNAWGVRSDVRAVRLRRQPGPGGPSSLSNTQPGRQRGSWALRVERVDDHLLDEVEPPKEASVAVRPSAAEGRRRGAESTGLTRRGRPGPSQSSLTSCFAASASGSRRGPPALRRSPAPDWTFTPGPPPPRLTKVCHRLFVPNPDRACDGLAKAGGEVEGRPGRGALESRGVAERTVPEAFATTGEKRRWAAGERRETWPSIDLPGVPGPRVPEFPGRARGAPRPQSPKAEERREQERSRRQSGTTGGVTLVQARDAPQPGAGTAEVGGLPLRGKREPRRRRAPGTPQRWGCAPQTATEPSLSRDQR